VAEALRTADRDLVETLARLRSQPNWKNRGLGRKNSLWPMPYGTACCGIEMMSVMGPRYDLARFGAEVVRFSPRQADLLIVAGTITEKMAPVILRIYQQMLEPKYVCLWVRARVRAASTAPITFCKAWIK